MLLQQNCADERNQAVAVDDSALRIHSACSIHIRIKNDAQICTCIQNRFGDGSRRLFIFRVGDVVGEAAVRLQKLAARGIRAQWLQYFFHIEAAGAIARVYDDLHAFQRLILARPLANLIRKDFGIDRHEIHLLIAASLGLLILLFLRERDNLFDIAALQAALLHKEFQAVAVEGQMARRDHDSAVILEALCNGGHEHSRRGSKARIIERDAAILCRFADIFQNARAADARIPANADAHLRFAQALLQPADKACRQMKNSLVRQIDRLPGDSLAGNTAYIATVLKLR